MISVIFALFMQWQVSQITESNITPVLWYFLVSVSLVSVVKTRPALLRFAKRADAAIEVVFWPIVGVLSLPVLYYVMRCDDRLSMAWLAWLRGNAGANDGAVCAALRSANGVFHRTNDWIDMFWQFAGSGWEKLRAFLIWMKNK
jgi:hypothetical protein